VDEELIFSRFCAHVFRGRLFIKLYKRTWLEQTTYLHPTELRKTLYSC